MKIVMNRPIMASQNLIKRILYTKKENMQDNEKRIFYCKSETKKRTLYTLLDNRNGNRLIYSYDSFEEMMNEFYNREYGKEN